MKESIIIAIIISVLGYLYIKFELWFWGKLTEDSDENIEQKDDKKGLEKTKKK